MVLNMKVILSYLYLSILKFIAYFFLFTKFYYVDFDVYQYNFSLLDNYEILLVLSNLAYFF